MAARGRSFSDSQALDVAKANGVGHDTISATARPKEKKMSTLARLLRPWKWRRKKKSKQFEETSTSETCALLLV